MSFTRQTAGILLVLVLSIATAADADPVSLGEGSQPRIITDGSKRVAVVFGRKDEIVIATSADGGATFGPSRTLSRAGGMPLGMRRGPRAAMNAESTIVAAIAGAKGGGQDGDVWAWRSTDDAKTWKRSSKPLNSVPASAREGLHGIAMNRAGTAACVWLDLRNVVEGKPGTEIWMSLSKDGGATWQADRVVYRNPGASVCECCHPSVVVGEANDIHVMFRHSTGGARDMYLTTSRDGGKTFSEPEKLGTGTWPLNGCPMDGGDLLLDAKGGEQTVWMRDGAVYRAASGGAEKRLGDGRQPVMAATPKGPWTGWTSDNKLLGQWPGAAPKRLADDASFPAAAGLAGGVGVVWEQKREVRFELLSQP